MKYFKLLRVHHYIKNLLVYSALVFSGNFFNWELLFYNTIAFISFSLLASVIYIINDLKDVDKDKKHPKKKNRPIASGAISKKMAIIIAIFLFVLSFALNCFVFSWKAIFVLITYFILNIAYSFKLKNIPIVDIVILATGFVLRILHGSFITSIELSQWMYLTAFVGSLYMGIGKRKGEKQKDTREVLNKYPIKFLDDSLLISLILMLVFYSFWTMEKSLIYTIPLVLIIVFKYNLNLENGSDGDPVEVLLHDKVLILFALIYLITIFASLYVL